MRQNHELSKLMIKLFPAEYQDAIREIKPHDHLVLVHDSAVDQQAAVEPLVQSHLADGKHCIYLSTGEKLPFDTTKAVGTLSIFDPTKWAVGNSSSEKLQGVLDQLEKNLDAPGSGGAVLLLEEMQWAKDLGIDLEDILDYEARLGQLLKSHELIRICQYDRQAFPPEWLLEIIKTHKLVIYQTDIFSNPFYTPPEKLDPAKRARNEVERMLLGLKDLKEWENELIFTIKNLNYLVEINKTISGSVDLDQVVNEVLNNIMAHINPVAARVMIYYPEAQTLRVRGVNGFLQRYPKADVQLDLDEPFWQDLFVDGKAPILRSKGEAGLLVEAYQDETYNTYFAAPLLARDEIKGMLEIFLAQPQEKFENWRPYIEALVNQLAVAIGNAQAFEDLQQKTFELTMAYDTTMARFAQAMDQRDDHISRNTQHLAEMTERLARSMGASEDEVINIRRGVLLEDISKLSLLDKILEKPGPLNDKEWQIVHQHPMVVFNLLEDISILRPALEIPYCHNEHWDGSGYPRGLKGDAIPLSARQFAVVNVYDALLADRPYRPSWDAVDALAYIQSLAGTQFDPDVVRAFFSMLDEQA
jgi:response regulator RpfG family c-di-GMP phosphodiesterase